MDPSQGASLFISGDQQLVLSAEDAAQLLAQAGIQIGDNEQVIIGDLPQQTVTDGIIAETDGGASDISAATAGLNDQHGADGIGIDQSGLLSAAGEDSGLVHGSAGDVDDGTILYIDPNDPHAAEILQQAGLRLAEDGSISQAGPVGTGSAVIGPTGDLQIPVEALEALGAAPIDDKSGIQLHDSSVTEASNAGYASDDARAVVKQESLLSPTKTSAPSLPESSPSHEQVVEVGPDQQQVLYSVTGEDGKTQQYVMLCPKDMDQNVLIQTLVKQVSSDPSLRGGKKTIRIKQQRGAVPNSRLPSSGAGAAASSVPPAKKQPTPRRPPATKRQQPQPYVAPPPQVGHPALPSSSPLAPVSNKLYDAAGGAVGVAQNQLDANDLVESVVAEMPLIPLDGSTRVYVRCNYCTQFRSTLNGDTWEAILNHILPVTREELHTSFYGDLAKHFIRCLRVQINAKQTVREPGKGGGGIPQCEIILTHSLVCRKNKREFIVSNPDANFVANLAKHIKSVQPGNTGRGNSLLCIFCNSPFTFEDYLRHIQPHLEAILATLNCFAGAYCAHTYENLIRATRTCLGCQEPEAPDLRFLPCTRFSNEYSCVRKLQFAIDCFREHYGDSGYLRVETTTTTRCSVCRNTSQVLCAVFHISTTVMGDDQLAMHKEDLETTQLAVCANCQKQFINIVMKEQGFDERLKQFQLRNMEQLCSVLRVILSSATSLCDNKKTLIYTVHEGPTTPSSAVHSVKLAEVTQLAPITKLLALAESEIVGCPTKVVFLCDLCLFTVDLTSLVATEKEKQKNDMLMAIVLEHLVPHTDSLMNVIANTSTNPTLSLKYEILARTLDMGATRKITLGMQKKFRSQHSPLEIQLDKDEEKMAGDIRSVVKNERRYHQTGKQTKASTPSSSPSSSSSNLSPGEVSSAGQLIEANKFIDKQRGRLSLLAHSGCNTTLLGSYTECKLCSKYSFPDFRLAGALVNSGGSKIDLCENCVETVLTLCLPTEPERLEIAEECLALGEPRATGHRLVLSNNLKKWLSLDGVNIIKKTVDEYEESKSPECSTYFNEALKKYLLGVIKTCDKDPDITCSSAGFCITETFLSTGETTNDREKAIPINILSRKPKTTGTPSAAPGSNAGTPSSSAPVKVLPQRRVVPAVASPVVAPTPAANGTKVTRRSVETTSTKQQSPVAPAKSAPVAAVPAAAAAPAPVPAASAESSAEEEETVDAIQQFLDQTSAAPVEAVKVPAGVKITAAGKGVVNIRAVASDSAPRPNRVSQVRPPAGTSERERRSAGRSAAATTSPATASSTSSPSPAPVSNVVTTVTSNGVNRRSQPQQQQPPPQPQASPKPDLRDIPKTPQSGRKRGAESNLSDLKPSSAKSTPGTAANTSSADDDDATPRTKRQRREKKIFDL